LTWVTPPTPWAALAAELGIGCDQLSKELDVHVRAEYRRQNVRRPAEFVALPGLYPRYREEGDIFDWFIGYPLFNSTENPPSEFETVEQREKADRRLLRWGDNGPVVKFHDEESAQAFANAMTLGLERFREERPNGWVGSVVNTLKRKYSKEANSGGSDQEAFSEVHTREP
jgi:hypothetical protein